MATNTAPSTSTTTGDPTVTPAANGAEAERSFDTGSMADLTRRFERILQDGIESLRGQSRVYVDSAGQQLGAAQQYVTGKVKERPVAATMAGLGVGVLLGVLLAGRRKR